MLQAPAVSRTGPASMSSWEHAPAFELRGDAEDLAHAGPAAQASAEDQYTGSVRWNAEGKFTAHHEMVHH